MKIRNLMLLLLAAVCSTSVAQTSAETGKVGPVEIRVASNEPVALPDLGKKHLLIFYIDPDHASQNEKFREVLEKNQINSPHIHSIGVI